MPSEDLTPRQVAERLGVTVRTVQRWISNGQLPAHRVGARLRVSPSSLGEPAAHSIRSLLIANRGEIAARIARTARRLGLRTVAVHTDEERPPDGMDVAAPIESYLDGDALIDAARQSGADAVHPGYGFLAENAAFAQAVIDAGLVWVGPPPAAIAAMGNKAEARRRAAQQGVPTVPGYDGAEQSDETLRREALRIGLPILVKPSAGGGGKGMRVVRDAADLESAMRSARREAKTAFGDEQLILERYLAGPRHVEIQVLCDEHGAGLHLGERDCSSQRRNQKIVEESPAPTVDTELRARMGGAALTVAASVGYVNAGTVEFLLTDDGRFHFLEMNTRLQVEHAVTEAVTGRDLVADQLRIAAGEPLGIRQRDIRLNGHAIEARIYAEDPEAGFLPATGRVERLVWPDGVRVDAGVREGELVSDRYDPLLAKLIAHGETRSDALARLRAALEATTLLGVRTNLRFLRWLLAQPFMLDGETRTDTLARVDLPGPPTPTDADWRTAAGLLLSDRAVWAGGWRLNAEPTVRLQSAEEVRSVAPAADAPSAARSGATAFVDVDGQSVEFRLAAPPTVEEAARHAAAHSGSALLNAPMPGRVIAIPRPQGSSVREHEPVVVIEAMKMEHAVVAPLAGKVTRMAVSVGQQVQRGDELAEVSAGEGDGREQP
ncbi:MAG: helix-turn-helix domain-containing protein [Chloroflexota bacterium]|nr:helix-turn-helix domain-containing protein [Chloroflexota bacterium]